jgi:hypothetical protein
VDAFAKLAMIKDSPFQGVNHPTTDNSVVNIPSLVDMNP